MRILMRVKRGWGVLLGVPALFAVAYLWPYIPWLNSAGLCAVKRFSGVDCPGCGLIRSFAALAHGRIRQSVDFHPMGVMIALWLAYIFVREAAFLKRGRPLPTLLRQSQRDILLWAFLAAMLLQWVAKLAIS